MSIFRQAISFAIVTMVLVLSAAPAQFARADEPLPSWNKVASKQAIVAFVSAVTKEGSSTYVAPEDRIATFDNDGTLWVEKPMYTHLLALIQRMREQFAADPSLKEREPYRSLATKDMSYFMTLYEDSAYATLVGQLMGVPFDGMTDENYDNWGRAFLAGFKHPELKVAVDGLVYEPMIELIRYLEANDFSVYILTADEGAFLRLAATELYGLPPSRVLGTSIRSEWAVHKGKPQFVRTSGLQHLNNWDGKPRLIQQVIGKPPIFAAGNSNGDQHMLQYAALSGGLSVLIHHTDDEREYAYSKHTDKVMPLAQKEGWTVVDMKQDWQRIFPAR